MDELTNIMVALIVGGVLGGFGRMLFGSVRSEDGSMFASVGGALIAGICAVVLDFNFLLFFSRQIQSLQVLGRLF